MEAGEELEYERLHEEFRILTLLLSVINGLDPELASQPRLASGSEAESMYALEPIRRTRKGVLLSAAHILVRNNEVVATTFVCSSDVAARAVGIVAISEPPQNANFVEEKEPNWPSEQGAKPSGIAVFPNPRKFG
jgi:hypothetical protein